MCTPADMNYYMTRGNPQPSIERTQPAPETPVMRTMPAPEIPVMPTVPAPEQRSVERTNAAPTLGATAASSVAKKAPRPNNARMLSAGASSGGQGRLVG